MSKCTQCPSTIGDYTERDCGFPDCMGGWEEVYREANKTIDELVSNMDIIADKLSLGIGSDTPRKVMLDSATSLKALSTRHRRTKP